MNLIELLTLDHDARLTSVEAQLNFDPSSFEARALRLYLWFAAQSRTLQVVTDYMAISVNADDFTILLMTEGRLVDFINDSNALQNALQSPMLKVRLFESPGAVGKIIAQRAGLPLTDTTDVYQIVESAVSMADVVASPSASAVLAASSVALASAIATPGALTALVGSSIAMSAVFAAPSGLTQFVASEVAMAEVFAQPDALAQFVASEVAMAEVFAQPTALTQFVSSEVAMAEVFAQPTALTQFVSSEVAMAEVLAQPSALSYMLSDDDALTEVLSAANPSSFLASSAFVAVIVSDAVILDRFVAEEPWRLDIVDNASVMSELFQSADLSVLVSSPLRIRDLLASANYQMVWSSEQAVQSLIDAGFSNSYGFVLDVDLTEIAEIRVRLAVDGGQSFSLSAGLTNSSETVYSGTQLDATDFSLSLAANPGSATSNFYLRAASYNTSRYTFVESDGAGGYGISRGYYDGSDTQRIFMTNLQLIRSV